MVYGPVRGLSDRVGVVRGVEHRIYRYTKHFGLTAAKAVVTVSLDGRGPIAADKATAPLRDGGCNGFGRVNSQG